MVNDLILSMEPTVQLGFPTLQGGLATDQSIRQLEIPQRLSVLPGNASPGPDWELPSVSLVARMYQRFGDAIRFNEFMEPDFQTALNRHIHLSKIEDAAETGNREIITLSS